MRKMSTPQPTTSSILFGLAATEISGGYDWSPCQSPRSFRNSFISPATFSWQSGSSSTNDQPTPPRAPCEPGYSFMNFELCPSQLIPVFPNEGRIGLDELK